MKKYLKLLFVFVLALFVFENVNAANTQETYSMTISNANPGHTYEAYQIFTGTLSTDGKTLSNIKWGTGVTADFISEKGDATTYASTFTMANAKEKAEELGSNLSDVVAGTTNTFVAGTNGKGTYTIDNLVPGYYLIKDQDESQEGANDSYTEYIIHLLANVTADTKDGIPTSDKKIVEADAEVVYSSKYAVGDVVNYKLTGTLPRNYDSYKSYKYTFHDKLSSGLTLDANSVVVKVDGTVITSGFTINTNPNDGDTLDVVFANTKTVSYVVTEGEKEVTKTITKDSVITVEYSAEVNENAVRGIPGNENTFTIEFENNPYTHKTGKTQEIETKVYVFKLVFNKVDSKTSEALEGAGFTLEKKVNGSWVVVETIVNATGNEFVFDGLSVGDYKLTETVTPDGYNTLEPIEFTINATFDESGLKTLTGTKFSFVADLSEGSLTTNVENIKGSELPYTGGMGTILFTIIGSMLMGGAFIGFVRTKEEE